MDAAVALNPQGAWCYRLRGEARFIWSRFAGAVEDLTVAIKRGEDDVSIIFGEPKPFSPSGTLADQYSTFARSSIANHGMPEPFMAAAERGFELETVAAGLRTCHLQSDSSRTMPAFAKTCGRPTPGW